MDEGIAIPGAGRARKKVTWAERLAVLERASFYFFKFNFILLVHVCSHAGYSDLPEWFHVHIIALFFFFSLTPFPPLVPHHDFCAH